MFSRFDLRAKVTSVQIKIFNKRRKNQKFTFFGRLKVPFTSTSFCYSLYNTNFILIVCPHFLMVPLSYLIGFIRLFICLKKNLSSFFLVPYLIQILHRVNNISKSIINLLNTSVGFQFLMILDYMKKKIPYKRMESVFLL